MDRASCAADVAPVRAEPDDGSEQVTQALRGEPLTVEERRDGWARVRTAYDYPGWIRADALGDEPDGDWPGLPRSGDPVEEARSYLGTVYEWGGMTERGIDCSGLVHMAYRRSGHLVPRDAHEQEDEGLPVREDELGPGDLITYGSDEVAHATHVAFWLGNGRILHATDREGTGSVIEEPLENARGQHKIRFVRLFN